MSRLHAKALFQGNSEAPTKPSLRLISPTTKQPASDIHGKALVLRGSMAVDYCLGQLLEDKEVTNG